MQILTKGMTLTHNVVKFLASVVNKLEKFFSH